VKLFKVLSKHPELFEEIAEGGDSTALRKASPIAAAKRKDARRHGRCMLEPSPLRHRPEPADQTCMFMMSWYAARTSAKPAETRPEGRRAS
jgi:hypothetical protein